LTENYWGIGPNTSEEDELNVNYHIVEVEQIILKKIA
jgi:hypothetical protein